MKITRHDFGAFGGGDNPAPLITFFNSATVLDNHAGVMNGGLYIMDDLYTDNIMPALNFASDNITDIIGGASAKIEYNTTTDELYFTDASGYNFDSNVTTTNLYVSGKITSVGGVDPPYVSFTDETCDTIREKNIAEKVKDDVMQFWNVDNQRFEYYKKSDDKCYPFGQATEKEPFNYAWFGLIGLLGLIPLIKRKK